jgi:hypothetical protein
MRYYKTIFLLFLIFLFSCQQKETIKTVNENHSLESKYVLDSIDYKVINEAIYQYLTRPPSIGHRFHGYKPNLLEKRIENIKSFVVVDSTFFTDSINDYTIKIHAEIDASDTLWIRKITEVNKGYSILDSLSLNRLKFKVVSASKIKSIFKGEYGWNKFWSIYSRPSLIIRVSIPAYNEGRNRAMIYIEYDSSEKSGTADFMWLKKVNNEWIAYDIVGIWIL